MKTFSVLLFGSLLAFSTFSAPVYSQEPGFDLRSYPVLTMNYQREGGTGTFTRTSPTDPTWVEKSHEGESIEFREAGRTSTTVLLTSADGDTTIMLGANGVFISTKDNQAIIRHSTGNWVKPTTSPKPIDPGCPFVAVTEPNPNSGSTTPTLPPGGKSGFLPPPASGSNPGTLPTPPTVGNPGFLPKPASGTNPGFQPPPASGSGFLPPASSKTP